MREDLRNPDDELNPVDIETALAKLQPRAASVNRERLMFQAGKAAAIAERSAPKPPRRWLWPTATVVSFAASVVFAVLYGMEHGRPQVPERIVYVDRIVQPPPVVTNRRPKEIERGPQIPVVDDPPYNALAESRMLRLRHPALMTDVDHLPAIRSGGGSSGTEQPTVRRMRRSLMGGYSAAESESGISLNSFFSLGGR